MGRIAGAPPAGAGLLERDDEVAALAGAFADAGRGAPALVLVEGPAGIGKSRLLGAARALAADAGLRVLAARSGELEREFPYGVVRQLLEPPLTDAALRARAVSGSALAAAPLFAVGDGLAGEGDTSFSTLHGLYWLVANLAAEGPLALVVDDLHWCDHPSLRFLAYLARRLDGLPIALVASTRPGAPDVDMALVAELATDPLTIVLAPRALSADATAELVAARLGRAPDAAFARACHGATRGNPLLLAELAKALAAERVPPVAGSIPIVREVGPRAASRAVIVRLARLPAPAAELARSLAVLGDGAEPAAVAALAGLDATGLAGASRALAEAELVERDPPLRFVHPLLRAAVYRDLPVGELELRHARGAAILEAAGAPAEQVAAQLLRLPPAGDPRRVEVLRRAAADAARQGAPENAAAYLARALAEPPADALRAELLLDLGLAESATSGPGAVAHLLAARAELAPGPARARAGRVLARVLLFTGRYEDSAEAARAALRDLPADDVDGRRQVEALELYGAFFSPTPEAAERFAAYREPLVPDGVGARMLAAVAAWSWAMSGGSAAGVCRLARHALADGRVIEADPGAIGAAPVVALALAGAEEAPALLEQIGRAAHRGGSGGISLLAYRLYGGLDRMLRGDLEGAAEALDAWAEAGRLWGGDGPGWWNGAGLLARVRAARGDLDGARAALALAEGRPARPALVAMWRTCAAEVELAAGRPAEAAALALDAGADLPATAHPVFVPWRLVASDALLRVGRAGEALRLARDALAAAERWGTSDAVGRALACLGAAEGEAGIPRLAQAAALLDGSHARLEAARAEVALGSALRRARRPADAREPLRRGLELADACGATPLAATARAELLAAGARPRASGARGTAALTPSERRVAALALDGLGNREIAQALFVTQKTVEVHLSAAYRKLGIASRRDLAAALGA